MKSDLELGDQNAENSSAGPGNRSSWGVSCGRSPSSSISAGSPSSRSDRATVSASRLSHPSRDDAVTPQAGAASKKKKKAVQVVNGDKSGRGLRQFSMKVCEKVESKGRTTYNEVADELVAEFASPSSNFSSPDQKQYDEKNIRRRVYDALNVLMAMDIISKDKREIQWKGLPGSNMNDIEELKVELVGQRKRVEKKAAYLRELQEQYTGLQNLVERNERLYNSGDTPSGGVALPFILIQTRPHATVEVEISEDMQMVHFDLNSTPFELHDDAYVLRAMGLCGTQPGGCGPERRVEGGEKYSFTTPATRPNTMANLQGSSPIPGILKARPKHER